MGFTLQFCVRSISSEPFERLIVNFTQMALSVRQCAESMNWVYRLKVKVNFQGHGIYPLQFPVRSISPEPFERFSFNFTQMFLSARRCAEYIAKLWSLEVNAIVQGHGIYPLSWCLLHISRTLYKLFIKLHTNVPLRETVCRSNDSATETLKGHCHIRGQGIFLPFNLASGYV